tara:strand:- start:108 stop:305 length:198 start_codon:yes stop_codon:yes gene_type:complete
MSNKGDLLQTLLKIDALLDQAIYQAHQDLKDDLEPREYAKVISSFDFETTKLLIESGKLLSRTLK